MARSTAIGITTPRYLALTALGLTLVCGAARANDSFGSEFSHVVAGAALAATVTVVADHYGMENRGWVGFWTSTGLGFAAEAAQVASNGSGQLRGSVLDFGSTVIGATFGAWVTDGYYLQPVVARDATGHTHFAVALHMPF